MKIATFIPTSNLPTNQFQNTVKILMSYATK